VPSAVTPLAGIIVRVPFVPRSKIVSDDLALLLWCGGRV